MPTRANVFEGVQIGIEPANAPGTAVAAALRLLCTGIDASPETPGTEFAPMGAQADMEYITHKEHTQATVDGVLSFYDITYLLASLLGPATVVTAAGLATWTFQPAVYGPDSGFATYTVETGSAAGADRFVGAFVNSLKVAFSSSAATISGSMIGKKTTADITPTASPVSVRRSPAKPKRLRVEVGPNVAGLVKLTKCVAAEFSVGDRFEPVFTIDDAEDSFTTVAQKQSSRAAQIVVEKNSDAAAYLTQLRDETTRVCRITALGPDVTTGNPHKIEITFPFKWKSLKSGDAQGMRAGTFDMLPVYDETIGYWLRVVVVNGMVVGDSGPLTVGTRTGAGPVW